MLDKKIDDKVNDLQKDINFNRNKICGLEKKMDDEAVITGRRLGMIEDRYGKQKKETKSNANKIEEQDKQIREELKEK